MIVSSASRCLAPTCSVFASNLTVVIVSERDGRQHGVLGSWLPTDTRVHTHTHTPHTRSLDLPESSQVKCDVQSYIRMIVHQDLFRFEEKKKKKRVLSLLSLSALFSYNVASLLTNTL